MTMASSKPSQSRAAIGQAPSKSVLNGLHRPRSRKLEMAERDVRSCSRCETYE